MSASGRRFEARAVVITGASSGIGAAAARAFAREGARVALVARRRPELEALAREIEGEGGRAFVFPADLGATETLRALVDEIVQELGAIDVLVNAAGLNRRGPVDRWEPEDLTSIIALNLTAPVVLARLVVPRMKARGGGAIVSVASLAGRVPLRGEAVYSATKFALRTFTFALAEELEPAKIRVAVVSPGPVDSAFIRSDIDAIPDVVFAQPMTSPAQVAAMILESAVDGKPERATPRSSALLATVGYLFPSVRRTLSRLMRARGARAKKAYARRMLPPGPA
jgi:short-subunit dehydrogenase